jgi:hypothetical protein
MLRKELEETMGESNENFEDMKIGMEIEMEQLKARINALEDE